MPAALIALLLAAQPASEATLQELTRDYGQACEGRLYGQYDDMCSGLAEQIRRYKADLRRRPPPPRATPSPPAPPPAALAPAPPEPPGAAPH